MNTVPPLITPRNVSEFTFGEGGLEAEEIGKVGGCIWL
jgi:hypothetical protein